MKKPISILIVDDQALFREGLRTLLSVQPEFEVVGEAGNGEEALRLATGLRPAVVLMDLRMPVLDGVTATRRMHSLLPNCRVIVLTTFDDDEYVFEGLRAGAVGYLLKDVSSDKLYEAIRAAARGEYFLLPSITTKVMEEFARLSDLVPEPVEPVADPLSVREMEILSLVATGASNKEIASNLVIAEGTVKNHLTNILSKLGVKDRVQAVLKAKELGIWKGPKRLNR
jgi:DNA-binding NarL/FixJ family response regulator